MKLSEAIRLGAMLRPQAFGELFAALPSGEIGSCAFGAAEEAINPDLIAEPPDLDDPIAEVYERYKSFLKKTTACPACRWACRERTSTVIEHLNDEHRWTREQIADWVATIEPHDTPTVSEQPVLVESLK